MQQARMRKSISTTKGVSQNQNYNVQNNVGIVTFSVLNSYKSAKERVRDKNLKVPTWTTCISNDMNAAKN